MHKLYDSKFNVSDFSGEIKRPSRQTINFIRQFAYAYHFSEELMSKKRV